ncbi:MAG: undecaprenyl-phosphate glucose phosphotransferase [Candidatus Auribacterota bacterium]|jgi:exopolysaccharide biosynthesis polyprenyl glycosylphosphotransferase|nr:undecaprenyl-phosphate glucose phosphotransferase [Candidatus Auribacterota bacterium]
MLKSIRRHEHTLFSALLTVTDFLVIVFSLLFAYYIRFYTFFDVPKGIPPFLAYARLVIPVAILYTIILERLGVYKPKIDPFHLSEIYELLKGVIIGSLIVMSGTYLYREFQYSRGVMLIAFMLLAFLLVLDKIIIRSIQANMRTRGLLLKNVLIIGIGKPAQRYYETLKSKPALGFNPVGFLYCDDESVDKDHPYSTAILGHADDIGEIIEKYRVDEVVVALPGISHNILIKIIMLCEKEIVKFRVMPDIFEIMMSKMTIEEIEGMPFVAIKETPLLSWWYFVKRGLDIVGSGLGLLVLSPLLLLIAFIIKRTSYGPVFYKQERMGIDGKVFTMLKFRTMRQDAEQETGPVWATSDDTRKTKFGSFLRKTNLDELPQLINVFRGDMSIVGPRPERPYFVHQFKSKIPHYMSRHRVKSGITGWAQVNGLRGNTSLEERIKCDLYYIENWSLMLDLKIILKTFFAHKNAY